MSESNDKIRVSVPKAYVSLPDTGPQRFRVRFRNYKTGLFIETEGLVPLSDGYSFVFIADDGETYWVKNKDLVHWKAL